MFKIVLSFLENKLGQYLIRKKRTNHKIQQQYTTIKILQQSNLKEDTWANQQRFYSVKESHLKRKRSL